LAPKNPELTGLVGIFGATGNQGYGYTGNQALEKLRRSTNIELSYMMSKKTLLSVNGRGTLNALSFKKRGRPKKG
jgi:hypothetical protein